MMAPSWLIVLGFILAATDLALCSRKTVTVTTVMTEPFAMNKTSMSSPDDMEGYIIDLLDELSQHTNLEFTVKAVADGKYGTLERGRWNGMIGELVDNVAQVAAAPLTKTARRGQLLSDNVHFIDPPFMTFDLAVLMRERDLSLSSSSIETILDLGQQTHIKYGVVDGGSTANFFSTTTKEDFAYQRMWSVMEGHGSESLMPSVEEAVERVRQSNDSHPFAFIGEQYTVEYHASRKPCGLTVVMGGSKVFDGEYHLAVRKDIGQESITELSSALTNLNQTGRLQELYEKWWIQRAECPDEGNGDSSVTSGTVVTNVSLVAAALAILFFATRR